MRGAVREVASSPDASQPLWGRVGGGDDGRRCGCRARRRRWLTCSIRTAPSGPPPAQARDTRATRDAFPLRRLSGSPGLSPFLCPTSLALSLGLNTICVQQSTPRTPKRKML